MTDTSPASALKAPQKLDDVLIAMDVVDTLRHREETLLRELDTEGREERLVARLKEIYTAQGIEVSDAALREGVRALEEKRFHYVPPSRSLSVRLAELYIDRRYWLKPLVASVAAIAIGLAGWQFGVVAPGKARAEAQRIELTQTLPKTADTLFNSIQASTRDPEALRLAEAYKAAALQAARSNDPRSARDSLKNLEVLQADLAASYQVKVVYGYDSDGRERDSGVYRINLDDADLTNYYLIVEAIGADGRALEVPVQNEETGKADRVRKWAQRVDKETYYAIGSDKADDRIIQSAVIGSKPPGALSPTFTVNTPGGALTEWDSWR